MWYKVGVHFHFLTHRFSSRPSIKLIKFVFIIFIIPFLQPSLFYIDCCKGQRFIQERPRKRRLYNGQPRKELDLTEIRTGKLLRKICFLLSLPLSRGPSFSLLYVLFPVALITLLTYNPCFKKVVMTNSFLDPFIP